MKPKEVGSLFMSKQDATIVVEDHIKWLEGAGNRQTVADSLKWLFFYLVQSNCTNNPKQED